MTTSTTDARSLPLGHRILPDAEHVACKDCGTPCGPDAPRTAFAVTGRADARRGVIEALSEVTFGQCRACADLDAHAARILDAHPNIRRMIGSPSIGRHRIVSAFHALAVMGAKPADTYTGDGLMSLLDRLSVSGAAAAWHRQFSPIWEEDASRDTAASEPWLHVHSDLRAAIRREYIDLLADRMPARAVACPTRGCAWCGLGSVVAKRSATPWTPHTMSPGTLGGVGPHPLAVHLCPMCERIREDGGSMRSAVLDIIDPDRVLRRRVPHEPNVEGVRGWAVIGGRPNAAPWAHLDLDGLHALVARGDY
ncbi:hypothetical protein E0W80_01920 [Microbacterium sp. PI-1]|uniref:hypothetical protein n=1 Tax=Microbacterium sp. PI-1 TaxID=2545631 RepID=UPI00103C0FC8|nr:hypothetical protein [Microbacterium sp. PI-1]TCJ29011.1 hypothetical protein E0W80_01920 [Microbacterium sp. PI-1]